MKAGNIVLVNWPFTDLSGTKRRPAIILHINEFQDFLLLFITTQETETNTNLIIPIKPDSLNNLRKISYVRIDKLISLHKNQCTGIMGSVSQEAFNITKNTLSSFIAQLSY